MSNSVKECLNCNYDEYPRDGYIGNIKFSTRSYRVLFNNKIRKLSVLLSRSRKDLLKMKDIGLKILEDIENTLNDHKLNLQNDFSKCINCGNAYENNMKKKTVYFPCRHFYCSDKCEIEYLKNL